jgi:hypothetical protein
MLRKGFIGGYHFTRVQVTGEARHRERPNKNKFSHPHDALQYLCQGTAEPVLVGGGTKPVPQEDTWEGMS